MGIGNSQFETYRTYRYTVTRRYLCGKHVYGYSLKIVIKKKFTKVHKIRDNREQNVNKFNAMDIDRYLF